MLTDLQRKAIEAAKSIMIGSDKIRLAPGQTIPIANIVLAKMHPEEQPLTEEHFREYLSGMIGDIIAREKN